MSSAEAARSFWRNCESESRNFLYGLDLEMSG